MEVDPPAPSTLGASDASPLLAPLALIASIEADPSMAMFALCILAQNAADPSPRVVLSATDFIEITDAVLARSRPEAIREAGPQAGAWLPPRNTSAAGGSLTRPDRTTLLPHTRPAQC